MHQVTAARPEPTRSSGWTELIILFALSAAIAAIIIVTSAPASTRLGTTHTAVLVRGETTSLSCSEGVARVGTTTWVNDNESLDHMKLPMHGRVHVVSRASATFEAKGIRIKLAPAMPCTPG